MAILYFYQTNFLFVWDGISLQKYDKVEYKCSDRENILVLELF